MLLKEATKDQLKYFVFSTRKEMGKKAAADIAAKMIELLEQKKEINMIFAAAPSQNEMLESLTENKQIPWQRVNAFHMDEYLGLPHAHPQSFSTYLKQAVFDKVPFRSVQYIRADAADPQQEGERYAALLKAYPTDIVCLGIGENGHIAFNDPWVADFEDKQLVKIVTLDDVCRMQQVNDGCFASIEEVPKTALTLTIPALTSAKFMFCTVPAETKRKAVNRTINQDISEDCPASILRRHPHAVLYCDAQSGQDLL